MSHELFQPNLFQGKVLVITGGGSGIGYQVALQAAQLNAKGIAICGRRKEILIEAKRALEAQSKSRIFCDTCDIRNEESVENFVSSVLTEFGEIHILINNAGGQFPTNAESLSSKGFEAVIRNNLIGTWNFTRVVAKKAFIPQKNGCIVNVIAQIRNGFPGMVHTGAARAGVDNLTKTLSLEWARFGIRVNSVAPGVIKTTGTDQYPPIFLQMAMEATPAQRHGTPQEVAFLILYLSSSQASSFITGQTYYIDGGQSLNGHFNTESWTNTPRRPKL